MLARETVRLLESGHQAAEMTIESKEDTFPTSSTLETIKMDISSIHFLKLTYLLYCISARVCLFTTTR